jgi:hypothetical protein
LGVGVIGDGLVVEIVEKALVANDQLATRASIAFFG